MLARNLMRAAAGGLPITSPSHPDRVALYDMENISGATLPNASPTGSGADGVIAGAIAVTGIIGSTALSFTNTIDRVVIPKSGFDFSVPFSVTGWFNIAAGASNRTLVDTRIATAGFFISPLSSGTVRLSIRAPAFSDIDLNSASTYEDGVDHFFSVTVEPGVGMTLNLDDTDIGNIAITPGMTALNAGDVVLGNKPSGLTTSLGPLQGVADHYGFFSKLLSAQEETDLFNEGPP